MFQQNFKELILVTKSEYEFSNQWFENTAKRVWDNLIPKINPTRILEIGSFEGKSTCYLIDMLAQKKQIEIYCVDSWEGGFEHQKGQNAEANLPLVEKRFRHNTQLAIKNAKNDVELVIHKGWSDAVLSKLIAEEKQNYFDFIYVDGSHCAPDVLCDAVLGFRLLKKNGFMFFDDYLWSNQQPLKLDPIQCPKLAIDAFTNIYARKIIIIRAILYQLYIQKIDD